MRINTLDNLTSDEVVELVRFSITCPICGWSFQKNYFDVNSTPICLDGNCWHCKTIFKVRYKLSNESCKTCENRVECLSKPLAQIEETILHVGVEGIDWNSL